MTLNIIIINLINNGHSMSVAETSNSLMDEWSNEKIE